MSRSSEKTIFFPVFEHEGLEVCAYSHILMPAASDEHAVHALFTHMAAVMDLSRQSIGLGGKGRRTEAAAYE